MRGCGGVSRPKGNSRGTSKFGKGGGLRKGINHERHKNRLRDDLDCGVVVFTSHIAICEESEGVIGNGRK
jgi:hypothetical protein